MANNIMIVDDHPVFVLGLASLINNEVDMDICGEAQDEVEAISKIKTLIPDLIIVDLSLGTGSGLRLIKKVRSFNERIKILVSSMHDEKLYAERCLRAGADGYIGKQAAPSNIIRAIREVLNGKVYLSRDITSQLLNRQFQGEKQVPQTLPEEALSDREMEIFTLLGQGLTTRKIASELHLSIKTIDTHKEHIKKKLDIGDHAKLVQRAVAWLLAATPV